MSNTIIKVENLGKSYLIGHERQKGYVALRDVVAANAKNFVNGIRDTIRGKQLMGSQEVEEFWALKDVNFEIKQGEAVGIIGRNGAGKSTLLKILSRITEPTKGRIELNGRVASLLEVGTGFHPELSGRENIYLNGAILGMQRSEIKSKFDEIVDFSGVEKFLDTPVKRYSSGMYVRLAFAVAAHLEPEILVVDEVLAVGDAEFQKKCLGKMKDVTEQGGRTVLFVSHNMGAVQTLCSKGISLSNGSINFIGDINECVNRYITSSNKENTNPNLEKLVNRSGSQDVIFSSVHLEDEKGLPIDVVLSGNTVILVFKVKVNHPNTSKIDIGFSLHNDYDDILTYLYSSFQDKLFSNKKADYLTVRCTIKDFPFSKGDINLKGRILANGIESDWPKERIGVIKCEAGDFYNTGRTIHNIAPFLIKGTWESKE
jgi:lipopolysaccharide transport system ATP-binding protein